MKGQQLGMNGEEYQLSFDKFANIALSKVIAIYNYNNARNIIAIANISQ